MGIALEVTAGESDFLLAIFTVYFQFPQNPNDNASHSSFLKRLLQNKTYYFYYFSFPAGGFALPFTQHLL